MVLLPAWLVWCFAAVPSIPGVASDPPDARREYAAAQAAEAAEDWDAALLHYENVYDSTPTTPQERLELRRKFLELRPKVVPNTDPAKAGVWRIRVVVFRTLDFDRTTDEGAVHVHNEYGDEDLKGLEQAMAGFAQDVWEHTLGNLRIEWDTTVVDEPLREFHGWPDPPQCADVFATLDPGAYDGVMAYVLADDAGDWALWGGTIGCLPEAGGATYIGFNDTRDGLSRNPVGEVQIHEWLHSAQIAIDDVQAYPLGLMVTSDCGGDCSGIEGVRCFEGAPDQGAPGWMPLYHHILDCHLTRRMARELSVTRRPDNVWIERFCRRFLAQGPFQSAGEADVYGIDTAFIDEGAAARGLAAVSGPWEVVEAHGLAFDLTGRFGPQPNRTAYLAVDVRSDRAREVQVRLGSDDSCKLWQDGELLLCSTELRGVRADDSIVDTRLRAGSNLFLLKVCNASGGWAAIFRVTDPTGEPVPDIEYALPAVGDRETHVKDS